MNSVLLTQLVAAGLATAIVTLISSLSALIIAIANRVSRKADKIELAGKIDANTQITKDTHEAVDGKMETLLTAVKESSYKNGVAAQVDKQNAIQTAVAVSKEGSK